MEMGISVTPDAETVPSANKLLRCGSRVGIVAGGASAVPHRAVDASPKRIRFMARDTPLGVPLELGESGKVRVVAGSAFAFCDGLMEKPHFPFSGFLEIAVAGVACLFLVLDLQLPVRREMASVASVAKGRVELIVPEHQRRGSLSLGGGEPFRRGAGEVIHPHGFRTGLDAV
jgi:hypothetical protein